MANTEDILMEAYNLGLYEKVMTESKKLNKKYPYMEVGDRMEMALSNILKKKQKTSVQKIIEKIWENYMNVKGGDFLNWYEGLSPIEKKAFKIKFDSKQ